MAGAFDDDSVMTAVADHSGWYSFTFRTDKEIADGANFNLYVADVQVATGYTTDATWVYFVAGKDDVKWNSMTAAEAAYNETPGGEDENTVTTTVYFHRPSEWEGGWVGVHAYYGAADTSATGNWGETKMTVDSGDWYKVEIKLPENTANFNIIAFDENDTNEAQIRKQTNVTAGIGGNVYINAKGKAFTTKEAAVADEDDTIPKAHSYTIYMYAPDATSVTASVWGNFDGEFENGTVLTAVADHTGWYSFTFNTDKELKGGNGINLNIYVDGDNKPKYTEDSNGLYFVSNGTSEAGYNSFAAAEAAYAENAKPVTDERSYTVYIYAPSWSDGDASIHTWNAFVTGGDFGSKKMTAVDGHSGWYSYTFDCSQAKFESDGGKYYIR